MFCSECSKIIKQGSKFCKYCGAVQQEAIFKDANEIVKKDVKTYEKNRGLGSFVIAAACVVGIVLLLSNIHKCDWCGKQYIGTSYYDAWDSEDTMCEDCAREYYMGIDYTRFRVK